MIAALIGLAAAEPPGVSWGLEVCGGAPVSISTSDVVAWQRSDSLVWEPGMQQAADRVWFLKLVGARGLLNDGAHLEVFGPHDAAVVRKSGVFKRDTWPAEGSLDAAWGIGRTTQFGSHIGLWARQDSSLYLMSWLRPSNDAVLVADGVVDLSDWGLGHPDAWTVVPMIHGERGVMTWEVPVAVVIGEDHQTAVAVGRTHANRGSGPYSNVRLCVTEAWID